MKEKVILMVNSEKKREQLKTVLNEKYSVKISEIFSELPTDGHYVILDDATRDDQANLTKHLIKSNNELKKTNLHLEQRLRMKSSELMEMQKELETLSKSISYDLRTPLRAISGFGQLILEEYSSSFDDEGKRLSDIVNNNVARMNDLIDALLNYSYFNRYEIQPVDINMNKMVQSVYKELTTAVVRDKIDLTIENLPNAYGDPLLIRKVWYILLANAIKYTQYNQKRAISITAKELSKEFVYKIKDNGVGFDMEYSDKLFNAFQKLHSEIQFPGVGMGLALAKRAIKLHKGLIWGEGAIDKGASFQFTIPKFKV